MITCKIISLEKLCDEYIELSLQPINLPVYPYLPGQYLNLIINDVQHPFSIASSPQDPYIKLHIRLSKNPEQQANNKITQAIRNSSEIHISEACGKAYLRENNKPIIMIAGGAGFAPMKSMLDYLFHKDNLEKLSESKKIHLFWGTTIKDNLYAHDAMQNFANLHANFKYTSVLSEACETDRKPKSELESEHECGFVIDSVLKHYKDLSNFQVYMAGPVPMCLDAKDKLLDANLSKDNLFCDVLDLVSG